MLSSTSLKIIAALTMLIDHIGFYLFPDCAPLRIIGRISFPLFAFLLVQGFRHTHSRPKYLLRLSILAVLSDIVLWILAITTHAEYLHSVVFDFIFAFAALLLVEKGKWFLVGVPILVLIPSAINIDYGSFGVMLVLAFYFSEKLFAENRIIRTLANAVAICIIMGALAYELGSVMQVWSMFSILPIALYSGKKGRGLPKYFFYYFYLLHLIAILLIRLATY